MIRGSFLMGSGLLVFLITTCWPGFVWASPGPSGLAGSPGGRAKERYANLVLKNAKVWTVNPRQPLAQAVAIVGNRIAAVGSSREIEEWIGPDTEVLDLEGKLVLPGFIDAHVHFAEGGFTLIGLNLRDAKDRQEFARRIAERAKTLPEGTWITGGDWDHEAWPVKTYPTRDLIDPYTSKHPVLVSRLDGHVALANSLALKIAGITKDTPDPQGGYIERDPRTGEPTGILKDTAIDLVARHIPPPPLSERYRAIRAAMQHAAEVGVTSVHDISSPTDLKIYQDLLARGELKVRVYFISPVRSMEHLKSSGIIRNFGNAFLRIGAIKLFSDGSMGAGSALFFEPYVDNPSTSGLAIYKQEELDSLVVEGHRAGLQLAIHAIGDKANHLVLNAYEKALGKNPTANDHRHRIEHAQVVLPEDVPRFKRLGIIASVQPSHCIDDMRWAEKRIGPQRCQNAYRWRSFLEANVHVAFGTDWPVEPLNPMLGLYAAVTREFPEGGPKGGWFPQEKITMAQAIELYTLGSAYAEFAEKEKGSIEVGKLADLVVLSRDLFTISPQEILTTKVLYTILDGRIIYRRP